MVSGVSILAMVVTLLVTLVMPIVAWIVYAMKNKDKKVGSAVLLGAAGFFMMQIVIRLSIINVLALSPSFMSFATNHYVMYCLMLAFTAALVEVIARYVVAKILAKKLTYEHGIAAGLGHGGIEAVMLIGMTYINNLLYSIMINMGTYDLIVEQTAALGVDTSALLSAKEQLIGTSASLFLVAGYERILTMILHIALSLLVCYFVRRKKDMVGIGICLVIHMLVDCVSPVVNGLATPYLGSKLSVTTSYVLVYVFLTAVAVCSVLVIRKIKKIWR